MKIGDYVRTEDGVITKIKMFYNQKFEEPECVYARFLCEDMKMYEYPRKVKVSSNIINLIEEGDYINGLRVEKNKYGELYTSYVYYGGDIGKQSEVYTIWLKDYKENEDYINSILTKEQFESMEYRIESQV